MLKTLEDPDLVEIATMKLEGYSNAEIAERRMIRPMSQGMI